MRKLGIVVTAIACLMVATVSFAADAPAAGAMTFGANGGIMKITGDVGEAFDMGFFGGAFFDYGINEQFSVGVGADYAVNNVKEVDDVSLSIIPITLNLKWIPPMKDSPVAPYIMAGGGYYMMSSKVGDETDSESKPGAFGGAGVDYKVNEQVKVGLFGKYHMIFTDDESTSAITGGLSVSFGMAK